MSGMCVKFVRKEKLSCWGWIELTYYKIEKMANKRKEQPHPIEGKGKNNLKHQDAVRQRHIHLNWSNFKPEFPGKPEEDAEAHLLHLNDWMEAHHFDEDIKVQRFCLTLLGEARLWYQSLEPLGETTWTQLQNLLGRGIQN